jgi:DNA-binding IclR family transcriptional regulator
VQDDELTPGDTSVDKALKLLVLLRDEQWVTITRASESLGVARSTAHRLLTTLRAHGFAFQDPGSRAYGAGRMMIDIGIGSLQRIDLRTIARPEMEWLLDELGETIHLITLEGAQTYVLESLESRRRVRVGSRIGGSMPAHVTASGKAMLAEMDPEAVVELLGPDPLEAHTAHTITTHRALRRELDRIREQGYSTNLAENEPDLTAVAISITGIGGGRRAAIAAAGPTSRVDEAAIPTMVAAVRQAVDRVAERLRTVPVVS